MFLGGCDSASLARGNWFLCVTCLGTRRSHTSEPRGGALLTGGFSAARQLLGDQQ